MVVRGLSWFLLLVLWTGTCSAAKLGNVTLHSVVGEPISATIDVELGESEEIDRIAARIASPETHAAYGLVYDAYLTGMSVKLLQAGERYELLVSASKILREPYLEFVVELRLMTGTVLRSYTLLPAFDLQLASPDQAIARAPPAVQKIPPVQPVAAGRYTVRSLDSVWLIAAGMDRSLGNINDRIRLLHQANPGLGDSQLDPGDVLTIPADRSMLQAADPRPAARSEPAGRIESRSALPFVDDAALAAVRNRAKGHQAVRLAAVSGPAFAQSTDGETTLAPTPTPPNGETLSLELAQIRENLARLAAENAVLSENLRQLQQDMAPRDRMPTQGASQPQVRTDTGGEGQVAGTPAGSVAAVVPGERSDGSGNQPAPETAEPAEFTEHDPSGSGSPWLRVLLGLLVLLLLVAIGFVAYQASRRRKQRAPVAMDSDASMDRLETMKARTLVATDEKVDADPGQADAGGSPAAASAEAGDYNEESLVFDDSRRETRENEAAETGTEEGVSYDASARESVPADRTASAQPAPQGGVAFDRRRAAPPPPRTPVRAGGSRSEPGVAFDPGARNAEQNTEADSRPPASAGEGGITFDNTPVVRDEAGGARPAPANTEDGIAFDAAPVVTSKPAPRPPHVADAADGIEFDPTAVETKPKAQTPRAEYPAEDGIEFDMPLTEPTLEPGFGNTVEHLNDQPEDIYDLALDLSFDLDDIAVPTEESEHDAASTGPMTGSSTGYGEDNAPPVGEDASDPEDVSAVPVEDVSGQEEGRVEPRAEVAQETGTDRVVPAPGADEAADEAEHVPETLGEVFDHVALVHSTQARLPTTSDVASSVTDHQSRWWQVQNEWDRVVEDSSGVVTATAVFYIQLDNYESLEDQLGSLKTEELTLQVKVLLENELAATGETVHRIKDQTFLFLSNYIDESELIARGETLVRIVRLHAFMADGGRVPMTLSIAVVPFSELYNKLDDYLNRGKLTIAKLREQSGDAHVGDGVVIDRAAVQPERFEDEAVFIDLVERLLDDEMFEVQYQTLINLLGAEEKVYLCKTELSASVDPDTLPENFLKRAFGCRATPAIDRFAIRTFLDKILRLGNDNVRMLFRIDIRSAMDSSFLPWLFEQLSARGVDPATVVLFVYADDVVSHKPHLTRFSSQLKQRGIRIGLLNVDYDSVHLQAAIDVGASMMRVAPHIVDEVVESSATFGSRAVASGTRESARLREFLKDFHQHKIETVLFSTYNEAIPGLVVVNATNLRASYIQTPVGMIEDDLM